VTDPVISEAKIRDYLLNVDHPDGTSKARFFINGGFSPENPSELTEALVRHFVDNKDARIINRPDKFGGIRIIVDAPMLVPDGRKPLDRSVWVIDEGVIQPRLITALPG
jgi:hypothetical protein